MKLSHYNELFEAITSGDAGRVETLLSIDPALANARTSAGVSAFLFALYCRRPELAESLRQHGARLDIHSAAAAGLTAAASDLLREHPSMVNAYSGDGFQPLGLAAFFGQVEVAQLLIRSRAEINSPSLNAQRVMPLHSAVASGSFEMVQLLLEHGAEVNSCQANAVTPLHGAAFAGRRDLIELLLSFGASKDRRMSDGATPADLARRQGFTEVADSLGDAT